MQKLYSVLLFFKYPDKIFLLKKTKSNITVILQLYLNQIQKPEKCAS